METIEAILEKAQQRAKELGLPYKGALLPIEAYRILQEQMQAQLVDVRSYAELDWVGRIPGAIEIELRSYPGMQPNPHFFDQLTSQVDKSLPVYLSAAVGATQIGAAMATDGFAECSFSRI